jgi:tetratricopeptide (TPR) repeat protein
MCRVLLKMLSAACLAILSVVLPVRADGVGDADAGARALSAGDVDMALALLTRAIRSEQLPDELLAITYHHRGIGHQKQGDPARALLDYTNALQKGALPEDWRARALNNRATCFEALGDLEAALRDLNKALQNRPDYADAFANRAGVLRKMNAHAYAIQDYQRALRLAHPRPVPLIYGLGLAQEGTGNQAQAQRLYRYALSLDRGFAPAQQRLAVLSAAERPSARLVAAAAYRPAAGQAQVADAPAGIAPGDGALRAGLAPNVAPITGAGFAAEPASRVTIIPLRGGRRETEPRGPLLIQTSGPKGGPESAQTPGLAAASAASAAQATAPAVRSAQLGAFGSEDLALRGWTALLARWPAELAGFAPAVQAADLPRKGRVYRLMAQGPRDVDGLCRALRARGQGCIPARP